MNELRYSQYLTSALLYVIYNMCLLLLILLQGFKNQKGYPDNTQVTKVVDGGEPWEFRALFNQWTAPYIPGKSKPQSSNRIGQYKAFIFVIFVSAYLSHFFNRKYKLSNS